LNAIKIGCLNVWSLPYLTQDKTIMTPPAPNSIAQTVDDIADFQQTTKRERNEENHYFGSGLGDSAFSAGWLLLAWVWA
jgi:hypothetical protein